MTASPEPSYLQTWQRIARRIRVPLGFVAAGVYLWQLYQHPPQAASVLLSLVLVLPGLWLRAYASGYVQKNRMLTVTGPYAYTRNPLYLGSILIAAGFALALMSWLFALILLLGFLLIYIPVIASEERFLRGAFPEFSSYCRHVPRLLPRLVPYRVPSSPAPHLSPSDPAPSPAANPADAGDGRFSLERYRKHREYNSAIGAALLYLSLIAGMLLRSRHGN
jgi:protein-S-isoprenylcysteine O-methyltransferase Ste14